ncbi:hypothetical protein [Streptomyces sp. NPDC086777]|uniref:hypothetical protein n=1 Tax=Streptomyces sp. NPDC086777 TaxID=3154866 RepID=UPI00344D1539
MAEALRTTGTVGPGLLLAATAEFVDPVLASGDDVVIADALVPFVPTLPATGHDEEVIDAFLADLTEVFARVSPVMVFLDGNAGSALSRAAGREGGPWLDRYVARPARCGVSPPVRTSRRR